MQGYAAHCGRPLDSERIRLAHRAVTIESSVITDDRFGLTCTDDERLAAARASLGRAAEEIRGNDGHDVLTNSADLFLLDGVK